MKTTISSTVCKRPAEARTRVARILVTAGSALLLWMPVTAQAQAICGPEVKEEVAKAFAEIAGLPEEEQLALEKQLYEKYLVCAQDSQFVGTAFYGAARQCGATVSNLGSLLYEEMSCSGYDPQRRQFASPIKIKQVVGFGPAPLPGSREYVLHCVANAAGIYVPVGLDSVHLANSLGDPPTWQFAVIVNANQNLHTLQPMNGETRRARSILSWNFRPTDCNYRPIWGVGLNYRIRLDQ